MYVKKYPWYGNVYYLTEVNILMPMHVDWWYRSKIHTLPHQFRPNIQDSGPKHFYLSKLNWYRLSILIVNITTGETLLLTSSQRYKRINLQNSFCLIAENNFKPSMAFKLPILSNILPNLFELNVIVTKISQKWLSLCCPWRRTWRSKNQFWVYHLNQQIVIHFSWYSLFC